MAKSAAQLLYGPVLVWSDFDLEVSGQRYWILKSGLRLHGWGGGVVVTMN